MEFNDCLYIIPSVDKFCHTLDVAAGTAERRMIKYG